MYYFDREKMEQQMRKNNMTQWDIARSLAVSQASVQKWGRRGYKIKMANFERLTEVFDCSPNALCSKL